MNKFTKKLINYLFKNSEHKYSLLLLEKVFMFGIPFNKPHAIKFFELTEYHCQMLMKKKRANLNHLGSIHACAIATVGEFSAGILLCKSFDISLYRLIMKKIEVEYFSQARLDITSKSTISLGDIDALKLLVQKESSAEIKLKTNISDISGKSIACVETLWQVKNWSKVRYS